MSKPECTSTGTVSDDKNSITMIEGVESPKEVTGFENDAALGTQQEKDMSLRTALKHYKKASIWSIAIFMATIMEAYDMQLISSFYAFPQFTQKYGKQVPNGSYQVDANWQLGLSFASLIGLIFGVFASGYLGDKFGPRYVMIAAHCILTAFIAVIFTASKLRSCSQVRFCFT